MQSMQERTWHKFMEIVGRMAALVAPCKCIHTAQDLEAFHRSTLHQEILQFIQACAEAVVDIPNSKEDIHVSFIVQRFVLFMEELYALAESTPPIKQPMRFGNKAFRIWHESLPSYIHHFLIDILPDEKKDAEIELTPYISDMFGNVTRIDYGTGHELNFALFFMCLFKLGLVEENDLAAVISKGFVAYIKTMRKLQLDYMLEPAGSHGVWGLDDYHCLIFYWGSAQLSTNQVIRPSSIHDPEILREFADDYIYLEGIRFIKKIKVGAPFSETSPMLNDISNIPDWAKICNGLMRLFQAEVLNKLPVVQHVVFGRLLPCTWKDPSVSSPEMCAGAPHTSSTTVMPTAAVRNIHAVQSIPHHYPRNITSSSTTTATSFPHMATIRPSAVSSTIATIRPVSINNSALQSGTISSDVTGSGNLSNSLVVNEDKKEES